MYTMIVNLKFLFLTFLCFFCSALVASAQEKTLSGDITLLDGITAREGRQVTVIVRAAEGNVILAAERQVGPKFNIKFDSGQLPGDDKTINLEIIDVIDITLRADLRGLNGLRSHNNLSVGIALER